MQELGINKKEVPALYIVENLADKKRKYKMDIGEGFSTKSIVSFYKDYKDGKLVPSLKSEPKRAYKEKDVVHPVVGETYKELIQESPYDAVLIYLSSNCKPCAVLAKMYQRIASSLQDNPNIKFFTIRVDKNEVPGMPSELSSPRIDFFKSNEKKRAYRLDQLRD